MNKSKLYMVAVYGVSTCVIACIPSHAFAACGLRKPSDCVKKAAEVIVVATTPSVLVDVATGKKLGTTAKHVTNEASKGVKHIGAEATRGVGNVQEAGLAIGKYIESVAKGTKASLSSAERRLREGKVVDAFWHLGTDPIKVQEGAAAEAVQVSSLLNTVASTAASAYGGPGGAAAYAAWYAYKATGGNIETALKVGVLTGATSAGLSTVSAVKTNTAAQLAKKSIAAGAIGGLAVAAAGGDQEAVEQGFLLSGGMVLVQGVYEAEIGKKIDARAAQGEPYCMATVGAECSPNIDAYMRDADGNIQFKNDGTPMVDVRKTDIRRPHVGTWAKAGSAGLGQETGAGMTTLAKAPGMNAMSVFHDHWSLSWNMDAFTTKASIVPAVVLTYIGLGAPYDNHLVEVATKEANGISAPADVRVSAAATLDLTNLQSALRFSGGVNTSTIAAGKVRPVWVWIELPEAAREQISQVRYEFNHPTFRSPKAAEKGSGVYLAKWLGYGCINDAAVVATLKTGREIRAPFDLCDLWQNGRLTTN